MKTFADNVIWCCDRCYCQLVFPNRNTSNRKYLLKWHIIQHLHAPNSSILLHSSLLVLSVSRALNTKNIWFGSWRRKMCHQFGLFSMDYECVVCVRETWGVWASNPHRCRKGDGGRRSGQPYSRRSRKTSANSRLFHHRKSRIKFYSVTTSNEKTIWSWHKRIHGFEWKQSEYKISKVSTISSFYFKRRILLFVWKRCRFVSIGLSLSF